MKPFQFNAPMKIHFGIGSMNELSKEVCGDRIFVVIDKFLYESEVKNQLDTILLNKEIYYFIDFLSNPDVISINKALQASRAFKATSVLGIGGGSTLDIAKLLAVAINEDQDVETLRDTGFVKKDKLKSICIPTTAGTGSEVTNVSVISNYETQQKSPFVNDLLFADTAILDPNLTLSLPQAVTASCGMDTFCHAIEAYWNVNANDLSDILAIDALRLVFETLHTCYVDGTNITARSEMLKASLYAGLAFAQTRTTILHAVSFPLTSKFHIPHGLACAILLPSFIRYFGKDNDKLQDLAQVLKYRDTEELANSVIKLMTSMNMPMKLHEHGIKEDDLEIIATQALQEKIAVLGPKDVDKNLLIQLLKEVI